MVSENYGWETHVQKRSAGKFYFLLYINMQNALR
jgi:hypothetical protein